MKSKTGCGLGIGLIWWTATAFGDYRAIAIRPSVLLLDEPASALNPYLDTKDRRIDPPIERRLHHRNCDSQHATGSTGIGLHRVFAIGELVEFGTTDKIFRNPDEKQTEDYITGRYG